MRKTFILSIALSVIITCLFGAAAFAMDLNAKQFKLKDTNNKTVSLSDYRGKVVVLNFFASWCPACQSEMPEFNELDKEFRKSGEAVILAIDIADGRRETAESGKKYMSAYGIRTLFDIGGTVSDEYDVRYLPTTYIIDGKGVLRRQLLGATYKNIIIKAVKEAANR